MICRVGTDRQGKTVTIHNPHDFHTLTPSGLADVSPSALGRSKACVNETFRFVNLSLVARSIGKIGQNLSQHLVSTPLLKSTVYRFVVRIGHRDKPVGQQKDTPEDLKRVHF